MPNFFKDVGITTKATIIFMVLHLFLAVLFSVSRVSTTAYAVLIFLVGCHLALQKKDLYLSCMVWYLVSAEVLFRMTFAHIFWEYGKYAIIGILLLRLMRGKRFSQSVVPLVLYFLLLIPAIFKTPYHSFFQWRGYVSFYMSGALSLFICGLYFSGLRYEKEDVQRMLTWAIGPACSIAFLTLLSLLTAKDIRWVAASSYVASGGFGPNQVSSVLGFVGFLCVALFLMTRKNTMLKQVYVALAAWFFIQSILTLSRGGTLMGAAAVVFLLASLIKSGRRRYFAIALTTCVLLVGLTWYCVIPILNRYTRGRLITRYTRVQVKDGKRIYDTTGRLEQATTDLEIFKSNISGVGVSNARDLQEKMVQKSWCPHVEWTHVLAEHGMLGALALFFLFFWIARRYTQIRDPFSKSLALSFIVIFVAFASTYAMRTVLPGCVIGFLGADFNCSE